MVLSQVLRLYACLHTYFSVFLHCEINKKVTGFISVNCLRPGLMSVSSLWYTQHPACSMAHIKWSYIFESWVKYLYPFRHRCSVNFYWTTQLSSPVAVLQYLFYKPCIKDKTVLLLLFMLIFFFYFGVHGLHICRDRWTLWK